MQTVQLKIRDLLWISETRVAEMIARPVREWIFVGDLGLGGPLRPEMLPAAWRQRASKGDNKNMTNNNNNNNSNNKHTS